jgi:hypothetical protein
MQSARYKVNGNNLFAERNELLQASTHTPRTVDILRTVLNAIVFLFGICILSGVSSAAVIYSVAQVDSVGTFGNPDTATYGQTFVAPADVLTIDKFTFFISGESSVSLIYRAYVYEWSGPLQGNGGQAVGSAFFSSNPFTFTGDVALTYQAVNIDTASTALVGGAQYVAFLTISNSDDYNASVGVTSWGIGPFFQHGANNGGGGFVFDNNGNDFSSLTTSPWDTFADYGDLAFEMSFSTVPEPSTAVVALLFVGGGVVRQWRKKRQA